KTGGFSLAKVPRPGAPFNRRRLHGRPSFRTASGWPLCPATTSTSSHSTSPPGCTSGLRATNPLAEPGGHYLGIVGVDPQLLSDLLVGEVQAHEVQAQDPDLQRLVVPSEYRPGEVVEPLAAAVAAVPLASGPGVVVPVLDDVDGAASGAPHAVGPVHRPDRLEAPSIVDEGLNVDQQRASRGAWAIRRGDPS